MISQTPEASRALFKTLFVAIAIFLSACNSESTESENVKTQGIWARMEISADESRTRANVELNVGGANGTNLVLSNNEYLEVSAGGITQRMEKDDDFFDIDYQAYLATNSDSTPFTITLYRNDGEIISGSQVNLPPRFNIIEPTANTLYNLSDILNILWEPAIENGTLLLDVTYACTSSDGQRSLGSLVSASRVEDDGLYSIILADASAFVGDLSEYDTSQACDISIELERESTGTVSSAFTAGSVFYAKQTRNVEVILRLDQ